MDTLFIYLIKSSLSLAILFLVYELFFRKETYFRFSRLLLFFTMIIVMVLPLLPYNAGHIFSATSVLSGDIFVYPQLAQFTLDEVVIRAANTMPSPITDIPVGTIILAVYLAGVLFETFRFLFRLSQIGLLISKSETIEMKGLKFVFTEKGSPTCSFFNWIFIDPELFHDEKELTGIISHEKIHIGQGHSYDLIIAEILTIVQWFNPVAWLLKKTIKENHEYIADETVITGYQDADAYRLLLLNHSSIIKTNTLTHNFSYSLLKRRLKMMNKSKHPLRFGIGLMSAVFAVGLVLFACSDAEHIKLSDSDNSKQVETTTPVYDMKDVDEMPDFPGGVKGLITYLDNNFKYPESAKKKGIKGMPIVNVTILEDGSIGKIKIIGSVGGDVDEEALSVVRNMPKWKPGLLNGKPVRVSFTLPIGLSLVNADKNNNRIKMIGDIENDSVYPVVEFMPEFPGGTDSLISYLSRNIKYPEQARNDSIQGRVFVTFVIEKNGKVTNAEILRGIGGGCDEETVRIVRAMPHWKPGLNKKGEAVRVRYNIPVKYTLK